MNTSDSPLAALTRSIGLLALAGLSAVACASGRASAPPPSLYSRPAPSGDGAAVHGTAAPAPRLGSSVSREAVASGGHGSSVDRAPMAPSASTESGGAVDLPSELRPGLATEWGETLHSVMSYAPFVRASSTPYDVATIYYNDARLAAMQAMRHSARQVAWRGMYRDGVRVSLRDDDGDPLPGYHTGDTVYVLGEAGQRYTILIENSTSARFEAVVSVDGLDVINGRPASLGFRGYILPPYGRVAIEGFRQSQDAVAAFRFGSVGDSYAAQRGDARNVGVIGVALFAERGATLDLEQNELQLRERANPFPGGFAVPPARRYY